jgi:hypothetical protein
MDLPHGPVLGPTIVPPSAAGKTVHADDGPVVMEGSSGQKACRPIRKRADLRHEGHDKWTEAPWPIYI